jgi:hypothetical protein
VARFSAPVQTSSRAHPASYTMGTGSFPGVEQPGLGVDHPPHLVPRLKKENSYLWAFVVYSRVNFPFTFIFTFTRPVLTDAENIVSPPPHGDSIPGPSSPQSVAIPNPLSRPNLQILRGILLYKIPILCISCDDVNLTRPMLKKHR